MTELDDRLRDHYRGIELDEHSINTIVASAKKSSLHRLNGYSLPFKGFMWAAAAVLVLSLSVGIHEYGTSTERTVRTLNEAAMNHSTRFNLEFESENIAEIDESMSQLQFALALPSEFGEKFSVVGARYCTINGELAAHVKLLDKTTDMQVSLFMTRSVENLQNIKDTRDRIDGVNVKLWNESGLFYALASRSPLI
ncbi:MAG: hypothetical protein AB8B84_18040 [Granulosicoccus sp.]